MYHVYMISAEAVEWLLSGIWWIILIKGLFTVGRELRQQHPSDFLSGAGMSRERSKSRGCCCRNCLPTVINPDYNMTNQRNITRIYDKIRSKSPPNRATSPTCLRCDVTHLSLTTEAVALHIPSRRVGVREEHRQARKIVWPVNAGRVICRYQNNLCGIINTINISESVFVMYKSQV